MEIFMPFIGTVVNFAVVLFSGILGSLIKRGVPKRIGDAVMSAMAICVIYIGIDGVLEAPPAVPDGFFISAGLMKILVMIISMGVGTVIGEIIDIDKWVLRLGQALEKRYAKDAERGSFSRGFVSCTLLFCVGAMAINGAIQDALGNPDILLAKSVIDGISCFVMASTMGMGCAFAAVSVLVYQGAFAVFGLILASFLPAASVSYLSITGSLLIVLIGTNVLGCTKVKTANMIPAIFIALIFGIFVG